LNKQKITEVNDESVVIEEHKQKLNIVDIVDIQWQNIFHFEKNILNVTSH